MELTFFILFLVLSFALIAFGLYFREHTELSLIGFTFLFLLSFLIISQDIQYKTGEFTNITTIDANLTQENTIYTFSDMSLGGTFSHSFGYWLAVISIIGFIGVILSLRRSKNYA